jgi:hypothetical protein
MLPQELDEEPPRPEPRERPRLWPGLEVTCGAQGAPRPRVAALAESDELPLD